MCYCADRRYLTRYDVNKEGLVNGETIELKGEIEDMLCGNRFTIVVVRDQPESVRMLIFDSNDKL